MYVYITIITKKFNNKIIYVFYCRLNWSFLSLFPSLLIFICVCVCHRNRQDISLKSNLTKKWRILKCFFNDISMFSLCCCICCFWMSLNFFFFLVFLVIIRMSQPKSLFSNRLCWALQKSQLSFNNSISTFNLISTFN